MNPDIHLIEYLLFCLYYFIFQIIHYKYNNKQDIRTPISCRNHYLNHQKDKLCHY